MFEYAIKVLRVVDGDTVEAELALGFHVFLREKVRLYGVNTPETHGPKAKTEKAAGDLAAAFSTEWVAKHPDLILKSFDARAVGQEKYGRWLGVIAPASGGESLNDALIRTGNAVRMVY